MEGKLRHKRLKIVLAIVGAVIAAMIIAMAVYFGTYYHSVDVGEYLTDSDSVTVTETDSGWLFDGDGTATITAEEQRQEVIDALIDLLGEESDLDETVSEEQEGSDEDYLRTGMVRILHA